MMRLYHHFELEEMETLSEGQSQDLKVDENGFRVWLDRTGADEIVQYEIRIDGKWYDAEQSGNELIVRIQL